VQPCYLEVLDYWRKKSITEFLQEATARRLYEGKFPARFLKDVATRLDDVEKRIRNGGDKYLNDYEIKSLRSTCILSYQNKGRDFAARVWFELMKACMGDRLLTLVETLEKNRFTYARVGSGKLYPTDAEGGRPRWEDQRELIRKFGLASNDAAILNMVGFANGLEAYYSNDADQLLAISCEAIAKPTAIYTNLGEFLK
jgi:hypothetical protein